MKFTLLHKILLVCCLLVFVGFSVGSASRESLTFDEIVHIEEGITAWKKREFRVDTNNPPLIRELAVLPMLLTKNIWSSTKQPNIVMFSARLIIMLLGVCLAVAIVVELRKMFGITTSLFALLLFVLEPSILAYGHLITQDIGATLFFFLAYMTYVRLLEKPSWRSCVIHGLCLGAMAASKITTLPFYGISVILITPFLLHKKSVWLKRHYAKVFASISISLILVWMTYFFTMNVIVAPSDARGRVSQRVRSYASATRNTVLLAAMNFLEKKPVPLGDYIAVLKNTAVRSTQTLKTFFMGEYYSQPRWYFMLITLLLKIPVPLVLLGIIGFVFGLRSIRFRRHTIILSVPVFSILLASMIFKLQPQIRYLLPLYPFFIGLASLSLIDTNRLRRLLLGVLCVWYISGTLRSFPHFISYANELAGPKNMLYTKFTDSNFDWGQGLISLKNEINVLKPSRIHFSYFGRDDAAKYGFPSSIPYGSYKANEICSFHDVVFPEYHGPAITIISTSNWYECGLYLKTEFARPPGPVLSANSFLLFTQ